MHPLVLGYQRRNTRRDKIRSLAFPEQRAFIDDTSRLKAALCTRRAGKSFGIGVEIAEEHEYHPGATSLYVGLTRETCKRIMWKDILQRLDGECGIGWRFNRSELSLTHPNGAVTYFLGVDASEKEMAKALGQKYRRIWIDEAQSYRIDLRELVYQKLKPAVADYRGTISLHGTPGDFLGPKYAPDGVRSGRHLFFAVTKDTEQYQDEPSEGGWSVHRWSALDNPHMREQFLAELADIERDRPYFKGLPEYLRDYLGRWAIDWNRLIYRFDERRNRVSVLPAGEWSWVIGIDMGFTDAQAFTVVGYRAHDKCLYVVRSYKRTGMTLTAVADEIRNLLVDFPDARLIVDAASKQGVEELRRREDLPLVAAQKTGKADFMRQMSSDLTHERIVLVTGPETQGLVDEWGALVWDDRAMEPREDDSCENHQADSALYAWRHSRPYLAKPKKAPEPARDSEEKADAYWEEESRRAERRAAGEEEDDYL